MHKYGIEEESWFVAARVGLERNGFKIRIQPHSIIIDKEARLPRVIGSASEFLDFAKMQGVRIDPADYIAADQYGDGKSDLTGRPFPSRFETPLGFVPLSPGNLEPKAADERRQGKRTLILLIVALGLVITVATMNQPIETAEQVRVRMAEEKKQAGREQQAALATEQRKLSEEERRNYAWKLCKTMDECRRYADMRQECATAGDFALCLRVKQEKAGTPLPGQCNDDGTLTNAVADMPNTLECIPYQLGHGFSQEQ